MKEKLREAWKKIATAVGLIIAVWLLCPLPEISILIGLFGGKTLTLFVPRWAAYLLSMTGAVLGYLIMRRLGLIEKIKEKFVRNGSS